MWLFVVAPRCAVRFAVSTKGENAESQQDTFTQTLLFSTLPSAKVDGVLNESSDLQPWLTRQVQSIDTTTFAVNWVDRHTTRSIGTRSPDNVHYQMGASETAETVVYIGDLKSQQDNGTTGFTDEDVAHMIDFLFSLSEIQTWRHVFIGYLLNGANIMFFVLDFADAVRGGPRRVVRFAVSVTLFVMCTPIVPSHCLQRRVTQSVCLSCKGVGDLMLRGLLETPVNDLGGGFPIVTLMDSRTPVHLDGVLGHGGSSIVYRAVIGDVISAVKIITNGTLAATETDALIRLNAGFAVGVPRIVCKVDEANVIVTSPVGCALAATTFDVDTALSVYRAGHAAFPENQPRLLNRRLLRDALAALQSMHCCGVIHGDPRISNFIVVDAATKLPYAGGSRSVLSPVSTRSRECVVIDFGCAILGERDELAAAWKFTHRNPAVWVSLAYAPPEQLRAYASNEEYQPQPWHDLFMFAASLYRLLGHNAPQVRSQKDAIALAEYWESLMRPDNALCRASAGDPECDTTGRAV